MVLGSLVNFVYGEWEKRKKERDRIEKKRSKLEESALTLEDLRLQTKTYSKALPIVYGEFLLAGNLIWNSRLRHEIAGRERDFLNNLIGLGAPHQADPLHLEYYMDFAIAICAGEVDELLGIYIDGAPIPFNEIKFRFYKGSANQMPDPLIQKDQGAGKTPAFRGTCYIVFENFNLTEYGRSLPNFEFLIQRANFSKGSGITTRLKEVIRGVNLMPGSGEFVYDTVVSGVYGGFFHVGGEILDGQIKRGNNNTFSEKADCLAALDSLKSDLPSAEWVSVVVSWFSDSLNIGKASIYPACEFNDRQSVSYPIWWIVAGKTRWQSREVSKREDGSLNYGGTVCDSSLLNLLKELRSRGYKICLYPMIFVDTPSKPWRGRMTGEARDISNFFNKPEGYNNFILHYANLTKNLIDAFIIGSEMVGVTRVMGPQGSFPGVDEFINLAFKVRACVQVGTSLIYAADWSEYHSVSGYYNMDALWACPAIDFIGIDAYFPLTETGKRPTIAEIKNGWESGEGYDYYMENGVKFEYDKPNFAWKNIRWFVENEHFNIDGAKTAWRPRLKKIWFTEYGFPSVDLCTNQPNVFYDPASSESKLPFLSSGMPDFLAQKEALVATAEYILENEDIIENAFVWCYDLRPYPSFPKLTNIWADGALWKYGHWLNGKLGANNFEDIAREICAKAGILEGEIDFENAGEMIDGMCINSGKSASWYLKLLEDICFMERSGTGNGISFKSLIAPLNNVNILREGETLMSRTKSSSGLLQEEEIEGILPSKITLEFIDKNNGYEVSNYSFDIRNESRAFGSDVIYSLPIVLSSERIKEIAENILKRTCNEMFRFKICLPFDYYYLRVWDILSIENGESIRIDRIKFDENHNVLVEGVRALSLERSPPPEHEGWLEVASNMPPPQLSAFEIFQNMIHVFVSNVRKNVKVSYLLNGELFYLNVMLEQIKGKVITGHLNENASKFLKDTSSHIEIYIQNHSKFQNFGQKKSGWTNFAIIGGEVCAFEKAEQLGKGHFKIESFLRGRGAFRKNDFLKDDFLLISDGCYKIVLPEFTQNVVFGLNGSVIPVQPSGFTSSYIIGFGRFRIREDGLFLWWPISVVDDFPSFMGAGFENILFEISFNNTDKKIIIKGECALITREKQIEFWGKEIFSIEFYIKPL